MANIATAELLSYLEAQIAGGVPYVDIVEKQPAITIDDAYRVMLALANHKTGKGDRLIGYKAAYTSKAMQRANGMDEPIVGCLMRSGLVEESTPIRIKAGIRTICEPEIAVLLKRDLAGPGVSLLDAIGAVEGVFPAIEVADWSVGGKQRSRQMGIAIHKSTGGIVIGRPLTALAGIDLRLEGAVIRLNGEPRGSGTGVEVLGDPIGVVAAIANLVGRYGATLKAGMILMTGSLVEAVEVTPGDSVHVEFTRLGSVRARFA